MARASRMQQNADSAGLTRAAVGMTASTGQPRCAIVRRLRVGLALHINGCLVAIITLQRPGTFGHYGIQIGLALGLLGYALWHDPLVEAKLAGKNALGQAAAFWFVAMLFHSSHRTEAVIVGGLLALWSVRILQAIRRELA